MSLRALPQFVTRHVDWLKKTPEEGRAPKRRKILEVTHALRQMINLPAAEVSLLKSLLSDIDDDGGCCSSLFPLSKNPWK